MAIEPTAHKPSTSGLTTTLLDEATTSFDFEDADVRPELSLQRTSRMLLSAGRASIWLRFRSLDSIVQTVARRREHHDASAASHVDAEQVTIAVAAYDRLRPLVLTARDKCLQDSLTLLNYLAGEGLHPTWVIGVKTRPFAAHSWVQHGSRVLNDHHEHVRCFKPILVV